MNNNPINLQNLINLFNYSHSYSPLINLLIIFSVKTVTFHIFSDHSFSFTYSFSEIFSIVSHIMLNVLKKVKNVYNKYFKIINNKPKIFLSLLMTVVFEIAIWQHFINKLNNLPVS